MKKLLSLLLATSMSFALAGQVFAEKEAPAFSDISDEKYAWAKDYIVEMAKEGYIAGYEDGTYKPDNNVTRLETIVLFARAMGSNKSENAEILKSAIDQYGALVDELNLNFGDEEVSFMLYRGALSEDDLDKFLANGKAGLPMPRQEAAAIITKSMCGEADAMNEVLVDLDYKDAKEIDSDYAQYVYYASEKEIMNGMDGGNFAPNDSVLRSQIAVMLYRAVGKINLYIENAYVLEINKNKNTITIVDTLGEEVTLLYDENTKFYIENYLSSEDKAYDSTETMISYINDKIAFIDLKEIVVDDVLKGIYQGSTTTDGHSVATFKSVADNKTQSFPLSQYAGIYNLAGSNTELKDIALGSYVEYELSNDQIVKLTELKKDLVITNAIVESTEIDDNFYMTISHSDSAYNGTKLLLTDDVLVYKNNDIEDLSRLYKGDRVTITLEYGMVKKVVALSDSRTYEGSISEVIISANPKIKIKTSGIVEEFEVLDSTKIVVEGEASTLYDLRVGDNVKVSTESGAVLNITTTAVAVNSNPITGVIEVVNLSKGFIKINGETVFCNSSTTVMASDGSDKTTKDLKADMTVSVRGTLKNGAYTATLIIIED